jgi:rubrerythrin
MRWEIIGLWSKVIKYGKVIFITNWGGEKMLSKIPIDLAKVKKEDLDKAILRVGMIAELDAVSLYEQMAAMTQNENIKKVLFDIAKEEKTHVGEFQSLLLKEDKEQERELKEGKKEVGELTEEKG